MKLYFDGSCGPNNPGGYACFAFVISDNGKEVVRKTGIHCQGEEATNNVAEYAGLIAGLEYMVENSLKNVEIFGDSKLVINQVNEDWKCKAENLQPMLKAAHDLLPNFDSWEATWIPRDDNSLADGLSKWNNIVGLQ
jgi:ribonuclease HI